MAESDKPGTTAQRLRDLGVVDEGGLRLILETLLTPGTDVIDAGWNFLNVFYTANRPSMQPPPPMWVYREMLESVLRHIADPQAQHADTDGLAKQHDTLHRYLRCAADEPWS